MDEKRSQFRSYSDMNQTLVTRDVHGCFNLCLDSYSSLLPGLAHSDEIVPRIIEC